MCVRLRRSQMAAGGGGRTAAVAARGGACAAVPSDYGAGLASAPTCGGAARNPTMVSVVSDGGRGAAPLSADFGEWRGEARLAPDEDPFGALKRDDGCRVRQGKGGPEAKVAQGVG